MAVSPGIETKLDQWKNQLIDTTKRNKLLFFAPSKTASLRLTQPGVEDLFDVLVRRQKPLTFVYREPSDPSAPSFDLDFEGVEETGSASVVERTLLPGEVLTDREDQHLYKILYNLRLRGRTAIAEQGVNILFVAFGLLQWIDPAKTEQRTSPLILVPAELRRASAVTPYRLLPTDEDVVLNPTLAFLLERDCHLMLPPLLDNLDDASFEGYCSGVEAQLAGQAGWHVRREAYLGTFSFQKLVIYKDLEANTAGVCMHPIVRAVAADPSGLAPAPDSPPADQLDSILSPERTFQILDADSSQQEVIEAVKRGVSLVLQGPPGTGKSQTIANLIAEMLAAGQRILFVSEKMAALQVVHSRLEERNLNDFCLEIHSAKAKKSELVRELGRVLHLDPAVAPPETSRRLSQLHELRSDLNRYVKALHTPRAGTQWTPYYAHGQRAALQEVPELNFAYDHPDTATPHKLAELDNLLMRMEGVRPIIAGCETHPWRGCLIPEFTLTVQAGIHGQFNGLRDQLRSLQLRAQTLADVCHLPTPSTLGEVGWLLRTADIICATPRPPRHWFDRGDLEQLSREAEALQCRFQVYLERRGRWLARYRESLFSERLEDLRGLLAQLNEETLAVFRQKDTPSRQVLWRHATTLKSLIEEAARLLAKLPSAAETLAQYCGLASSPSIRGIQRLLVLIALSATDPRPTQEWFQRTRLRSIRERARSASEVYPKLWEQRARLLARYDPAILEQDLDALIQRFGVDYASPMRIVRPRYWTDSRLLRGLQKAPSKLNVQSALADLQLAREVRRMEQWVRENEAQLDGELGSWLKAAETSWDELLLALQNVDAMLDWFGHSPPPSIFVQLLIESGSGIATLQALYEEAITITSRTEAASNLLFGYVDPQALPFGTASLVDIELDRLQEWLSITRVACLGFWSAQETLLRASLNAHELAWGQAVEDLSEGIWLEREGAALDTLADELRGRYGGFFQGSATDWQQIRAALNWTGSFREAFRDGAIPENVADLVSQGGPELGPVISALGTSREEHLGVQKGIERLTSLFRPMIFESYGGIQNWRIDHLRSSLEERVRRSAELGDWIDFQRIQDACKGAGLESFLTVLMDRYPNEGSLHDIFYRRFYQLWLDAVNTQDQSLREFRGREQDRLIERFRALDRSQWEVLGPSRVRAAIFGHRKPISFSPPPNSEPAILHQEIAAKRKRPLRRLFGDIPNLMQELKPCLLMSPMTVSQLLDPRKYKFDLVVFDEASQICTEDAVGAIYRGNQIVVAGDRHQLPPTRFFSTGLPETFDDEDENEAAEQQPDPSILVQCQNRLITKSLRWHYRSRHESLIAFSNVHIYSVDPGGSLKTFPSARSRGPGLGVELIHVPNAVYDRRKTRRNLVEARKVAELVIGHMLQSPQRSLGVVAFSEAQQMAILAELERLRVLYRDLDDLFSEDRREAFFVKNLENAQGDERDVILLDVGYGRDASGELSLNFGPLNREGGERRLNVAITRAKFLVLLVTSLLPEDIDLRRTHSRGVQLLRAYLEYALRGPAALSLETGDHADEVETAFPDAVRSALRAKGHTVSSRIGLSGYRVDLAISDSADPDCYALGIECDGGEYPRAATARDRDRLSIEVLAGHGGSPGLGWCLHRVWSADWIKDPEGELERIEASLARSPQRQEQVPSAQDASLANVSTGEMAEEASEETTTPDEEQRQENACAEPSEVIPYQRALLKRRGSPQDFYSANLGSILDALVEVVRMEGPILLIEATRRVAAAWDLKSTGTQIKDRVKVAAGRGEHEGILRFRDGFLWLARMEAPPIRTHEGGEFARKIEEICREEIEEALLLGTRRSFSLPVDDLIDYAARILGFARTGPGIRTRITEALQNLLGESRLTAEDGMVILTNGG